MICDYSKPRRTWLEVTHKCGNEKTCLWPAYICILVFSSQENVFLTDAYNLCYTGMLAGWETNLAGYSVGLANLVSPVAPAHRDHWELGQDDGSSDGSGHLLGALHSKPHMTVVVPNGNKGLEAGTLAGTGLLLHRHDLEDLILQCGAQEKVYDLKLLETRIRQWITHTTFLQQCTLLGENYWLYCTCNCCIRK